MDLKGKIEQFDVPRGYAVYNPTSPFTYQNKLIIGARVEPVDNEFDSSIVFFEKNEHDVWVRRNDLYEYRLQDPFITKIDEDIILGGVEAENNDRDTYDYKIRIYKGSDLNKMEQILDGPNRMKGIRFVKLRNGKIALFTRPQIPNDDDPFGRGRIAYAIIDSLDRLNSGIYQSEIIPKLFGKYEWGGNNEIFELENGEIGILGHKAYYSKDGKKNYYCIAIQLDYINNKIISIKTIAERESFPEFMPRKPELHNVLYTAGIVQGEVESKYRLYVGISDIAVGSIEIDNPFSSKPIDTLA